MRVRSLYIVFSILLSFAGLAFAQGPVSGQIQAFIVTMEEGKEKKILSSETAPGQIMEFQIVFTNSGDSNVRGIKVVDPIPANTLFIGNSNTADVSADFEVSIDGGGTFELEPVVRTKTLADGSVEEVVIPPEQYTHVRWVAEEELQPQGGQHRYSYRVEVK